MHVQLLKRNKYIRTLWQLRQLLYKYVKYDYYMQYVHSAMSDKDGRNTQKNHVSDSGVVPRSSHQASLKTRYCGHLYSSLIRKWTWVDHRDQVSLYKER